MFEREKWVKKNKEKLKKYHKKWRDDNRDKIKEYNIKNSTLRLKYNGKVENRFKRIARSTLNNALQRGDIVKPKYCIHRLMSDFPCEGRLEAHHDDYEKPLDVLWFCIKHHRKHDLKTNSK